MRIRHFILSLAFALPCFAEPATLTGRVLDADGKPVAGADVGSLWQLGPEARPIRGATTGEDGSFSATANWNGRSAPLFAMDSSRKRGALVIVEDPAKPVELRVAPLVKVSASLDRDLSSLEPASLNVQWIVRGKKPSFGSVYAKSRAFDVLVPPGDYTVAIAHGELRYAERDVTVPAGEAFDAGTLATELTPIAASYGKPAPDWFAADVRGLPKDVQPKDLKGKWVLIEFWGVG
ncbi:MAG: hypothetical protein IT452_12355 [Planctomycetia bacterium]|nr:hypothetical protein [Planctomycetia bacterium]